MSRARRRVVIPRPNGGSWEGVARMYVNPLDEYPLAVMIRLEFPDLAMAKEFLAEYEDQQKDE